MILLSHQLGDQYTENWNKISLKASKKMKMMDQKKKSPHTQKQIQMLEIHFLPNLSKIMYKKKKKTKKIK